MITILDQYELYEAEITISEIRELQRRIEKRVRLLSTGV